MFIYLLKTLLVAIVLITINCNAERTKDKMYEVINGHHACFRRLNATHQMGCSSSRKGTTGVIHFVKELKDLHFIIENGTSPPYVPVMPVSLLTNNIIYLLKNSNKISGILFYKNNETLQEYSHEDTCPNRYSNMKNTCNHNWNKYGTGILQQDLPFPIFYINENEDMSAIKDCFNKFNNFSYQTHNVRALCSIELSSFMFATTNTPTCLRRSNVKTNFNPAKFCDPIGDYNVWSSLFPIAKLDNVPIHDNLKHIIIAARLDTTSLFHDMMPGAVNPITGLVTLLTTANLLKKMLPFSKKYDKNVLFMLFNGETYDYIGSQRMVYDMERGVFPTKSKPGTENYIPPIKLNDISLIVEINQLSKINYIHAYDPDIHNKTEIKEFKLKLRKYGKDIDFEETANILPPSSLQSFVNGNYTIPGIVLTDHDYSYTNKFYNSIYDNEHNINYTYYPLNETDQIPKESIQYHIANISNILAKSVYEEITGNEYKDYETADVVIVNELLNCYLLNANCSIHHAIQRKRFSESAFNLYVGVTVSRNLISHLIGLSLSWLMGDNLLNNSCTPGLNSPMYTYYNMSRSLYDLNTTNCYRVIMNFTDAISPAFLIKDYDWSSGKYSSWSESTWDEFGLRLFLKPSLAHENMTIAIGSLVLVFSFALVYFVKTRSHILFAPPVNTSPTRC